jgi:hypothetical protein
MPTVYYTRSAQFSEVLLKVLDEEKLIEINYLLLAFG